MTSEIPDFKFKNSIESFLQECEKNEPACILLSKGWNRVYMPFMHQQYLYWKFSLEDAIRVFIGDEIGLGKTIEGALLIKMLIERGAKRILILVPKILRKQWYAELTNFFSDYYVRMISGKEELQIEFSGIDSLPDYRIFIVSIDFAKRKEHAKHFRRDWDVLLVDEAHNLGSDTQRDELVREIRAKNKIFLSATPHRGDDDRFLRTISHIKPVKTIDEARDLLIRRTKRLVNSVRKNMNYKPLFKNCRVCAVITKPTEEEKKFSNETLEFLRSILKIHVPEKPLGLITAIIRKRTSSSPRAARKTLQRIISGVSGVTGEVNEKILEKIFEGSIEELSDALEEMGFKEVDEILEKAISGIAPKMSQVEKRRLDELLKLAEEIEKRDSKLATLIKILKHHSNEKIIIFTEYIDTLTYLSEKLADFNPICIHGGLGENESNNRINEFLEKGRVLIATDVASEGLNLQKASVIVNYEPPWTPIKLEQRIGRIWRLLQERDVIVYNLFLGTRADKEVAEKLYGKILNLALALEDVKNVLGEEVIGADIKSSEDIISPGVSFSEHDMIKSQLEGQLDRFIAEIEDMIRDVKEKLSSIYHEENAHDVSAIYRSLGIISAEEAKEAYDFLRKAVKNLNTDIILVPWDKERVEFAVTGIARVEHKNGILEFPMIFRDSDCITGSAVLKTIKEALERAIVPDEIHGLREPDVFVIKKHIVDFIKKIRAVPINKTDFKKFFTMVYVPISTGSTSKQYINIVGQEAEDIVRNLEEKKGRIVIERKTLGKYDFYSFEPLEKNKPEGSRDTERFIEVKGHGYGGVDVTLTNEEFKFAKENREKYWLYIVWNVLRGDPLIACFKDPLSKKFFNVVKKEEVITIKKELYVLTLRDAGKLEVSE
ncbi:MAG: helicase-related protein [Archaeoglobaceae archaeon]|nr:helicase-related protein [Archaeoglobaceae archaeon]MDW8118653.1 helicase-related protein [Archaeoglobaceae archaeon]